jgi:flagellar biogenesis protein FliO
MERAIGLLVGLGVFIVFIVLVVWVVKQFT